MTTVLIAGLVGTVFAIAIWVIVDHLRADRDRRRRRRAAAAPAGPVLPPRTTLDPPPPADPEAVLAPRPALDGESMYAWLVRRNGAGEQAWDEVARRFCTATARIPAFQSYFDSARSDATLPSELRLALELLTDKALTEGTLRWLLITASRLQNEEGVPLNASGFDSAAGVLMQLLRDEAIPAPMLRQLEAPLHLLRTRLDRAERRRPTSAGA